MKILKQHSLILLSLIAWCFGLVGSSCESPNAVTSVELSADSLSLQVGETAQLEVIVLPLSANIANTVYWKSSDTRVATVDARGNVTAVYSGTCIITATCDHVTARCKVTVGMLNFNLDFDNASAYFYGDAYKNNTYNTTLRLFDDGLTLDANDNIQGAGYFLNLDLIGFPIDTLPTGKFTAAVDTALPPTFLPGALVERNGIYYAAGSFLGLYTTDGLGVVFIQQGECQVEAMGSGVYQVTADLVGDNGEEIHAVYRGEIDIKDRTENAPQPETITFNLSQATPVSLGEAYGNGLQVYRLTATQGNYTLQMECYVPLSATSLPDGLYKLSQQHKSFSLVPSDTTNNSGTLLLNNGQGIAIVSGSLKVSSTDKGRTLECRFQTADFKILEGK